MSICDQAFGPRASCRSFDFTLFFEDVFLAVIPSAVFLLLLPVQAYLLLRGRQVVRRSNLLTAKSSIFVALFICQTVFLALRSSNVDLKTKASLAADVLGLAATVGAASLSWLDHHRSIRPSALLEFYLGTLVLLDVSRLRTLWDISGGLASATTFSFIIGLTSLALLFESIAKDKSLRRPDDYTGLGSEPFSGFWKRIGFAWLIATLREGYQKILSVDDLPALDPQLETHGLHYKLESTWNEGNIHKKNSLLWACFGAYAGPFLAAVPPRLFLTGFTYAQPFMINTLTAWFQDKTTPEAYGKGMIGAYALVYVGMAASTSFYWYQTFRFLIRLRGGLISIIYQETVRTRAIDTREITGLTLMGTDVDRIMVGFRSIHEVWASLLEISIAIYLLERQLQVACLVPTLIVIAFVLVTFKLSAWAKSSQRVWVERVEKRLDTTSTMLGNMKAIKMLGFTNLMFDVIDRLQSIEVVKSSKFRKTLIGQLWFSNSPSSLAPVMTFAVYVAISISQGNNSLLASRAFTSLSLISLLTSSALTFIQAIPSMIQCMSCFDRIQEYCSELRDSVTQNCERQKTIPGETQGSEICLQDWTQADNRQRSDMNPFMITFHGQSFGWTKSGPALLKGLDLQIRTNRITLLLGATASGKSTLLESIVGETAALDGWTERNFSTAAYCSQVPWLINGSIRDNIIGASPADEYWYASVLQACALVSDIGGLPRGDGTMVGSNGLNMSGGQRQRISLARAVYSRCKVVLLDDVFSGLDSHTMELISNRLFGQEGLFRRNQMTVVLATHASALLSFADDVVVLDEGRVLEAGSLKSLQNSGVVANLDIKAFTETTDLQDISNPTQDTSETSEALSVIQQEATDLKRWNGDFSVYKYYSNAAGHGVVVLFLASGALWAFCDNFSTVWLNWWSDANARNPQNHNVGLYLGIYAGLGVGGAILLFSACWFLFVDMISNSVRRLHCALLKTTLRAPLRLFQETDVGSITNRFSQDMELVGMDFPILIVNYVGDCADNGITQGVTDCLAKAIILAIYAKYLAVTMPFLVAVVYLVQKFYLRTSRQVRLLDIEAKAPIFLHFLETVSGASTIRILGWETPFKRTLENLLDRSQRAVYLLYCVQQWLALVLDLIVAGLAVVLVAIIVTWRDSFDAGAVGVALVVVMTFNQALMSVVKYWTMLETSVGAVSRIKSFVETTESEEIANENTTVIPQNWPKHGGIQFSDVVASHSPNGIPVLKRLSLTLKPGQKLGICGRSGSGKTSLILSLLRMLDLQHGSITIDTLDISNIAPETLRQRINVVPQDPFLMPGSVRFNLDPYTTAQDEVLVTALQKLGMWNRVRETGGLDAEISPAAWSVGEKQLLCLARAIVRKSPVLVLDEATSSVDSSTEKIMQDAIDSVFADCTVLAVVHRLGSIRGFDKVAVLQGGEIVEFDDPNVLLARDDSILSNMYKAGGYGS